jgi:serine/threonine-protein kinase
LGEVFVANDEELNREVALKEIQPEHAVHPEHRARFLVEAEITGNLEHPGIVPVYGLGCYADGRPYYAMRFIKGDSLQEAIRRFHSAEDGPRAQRERSLALRELLGRFVDVCQAIAYAHSRGVLHRDLKPGNIMLGSFGETLVVDWGLAKATAATSVVSPAQEAHPVAPAEMPTMAAPLKPLGESVMATPAPSVAARGQASDAPLTPRSATPKDMGTQVGQAIGTPAYMSPEQASGQLDQVGPASDVYSLGATLYHLLTGRPPFEGSELPLLLSQVKSGALRRPRSLNQAVPAALEAICLKAMAKTPAERYAGAQDLAADVERWLADEPVHAYHEPWTVRARRWLSRHRVATASAAVAVLMAFVGLCIIAVLTRAAAVKQRELREQETAAKEEANHNLVLAQAAEREEIRQQRLAQARLEKGVEAIERMVNRVTGEQWANRPELERERREALEDAIVFFKELGSEESKDPTVRRQAARAYLQSSGAQVALGEYAKSDASAKTALQLYQGLADQFPSELAPRLGQVDASILLGGIATLGGRYEVALGHFENASKVADLALHLSPDDEKALLAKAEALVGLARFYSIMDPPRSERGFAQALAITQKLLSRPNPSFRARLQAAACLLNLGANELARGRPEAGKATFERAREILVPVEKQPAPDPQSAALMGQTQASLDVYRGVILCQQGKKDEGLAMIGQAVERLRRLRALLPGSFSHQFLTMQHLATYGLELTRHGKGQEAEPVFTEIDQIRANLLTEVPQMAWLKSFGDVQRSEFLIWKVQAGRTAGVEAEMDQLVKRADTRSKQTLEYNTACLSARLAQFAPQAEQERHAREAVKRLNELLKGGFFNRKNRLDHLDDDPDLTALRERPDFKEFLKNAKAAFPKPD